MKKDPNIVLVGFMGTGKTAVGKRLAERLDMSFVDMDDIIKEREEKSISLIFSENGEQRFRSLERDLVRELSGQTGLIIATGGGIVLDPANISDYARTGLVVCLSATPEVILERVAGDANRPLLAGDREDKMKKILNLLESRRPLYDAIPCRIDTTELNVEQVTEKILSCRD